MALLLGLFGWNANSGSATKRSAPKAANEAVRQTIKKEKYAPAAKRSPVVAVEFTGQACRYCPNVARNLHEWQEYYTKERFLIAALHPYESYSYYGVGPVRLYHPEAEQYSLDMDAASGLPHVYYNSLGIKVDDDPLEVMMEKPDLLECEGEAKWTSDERLKIRLNTRLRVNRAEEWEGKEMKVLLWVLENDVNAYQNDNGAWDAGWMHEHLFRGALNGHWGETYRAGTPYEWDCPLPKEVDKAENCEVMALFILPDLHWIVDAACFEVKKENLTAIDEVKRGKAGNAAVMDLQGKKHADVKEMERGAIYVKDGQLWMK